MSNKQQSLSYLRAIQKKHQPYFSTTKLDIVNCVAIIDDGKYISVHVLNNDLPFEIKYDIECMFWR